MLIHSTSRYGQPWQQRGYPWLLRVISMLLLTPEYNTKIPEPVSIFVSVIVPFTDTTRRSRCDVILVHQRSSPTTRPGFHKKVLLLFLVYPSHPIPKEGGKPCRSVAQQIGTKALRYEHRSTWFTMLERTAHSHASIRTPTIRPPKEEGSHAKV